MELEDKIDLCLRFHDKVHFFWNWFAVIMFAVVVWSVSEEGFRGLSDTEKGFATFVVAAYMV